MYIKKCITSIYLTLFQKYIKSLLDPELTANEDPVMVCKAIKETIAGRINNLSKELYSFLGDEYVSDLLKLAEIPFELKEHQRIFIQDIQWTRKKKSRGTGRN